ncbi:MAG: hypothetical protein R3B68_03125 [Phycisphaerales bacterium]
MEQGNAMADGVPEGVSRAVSERRRPGVSRGLLALNAGLVVAAGLVALAPLAQADRQPGRARGVYTMVNGVIQGGNADAIWIIDSANQEMVVVRWNDGRNTLEGIGYRSLSEDAAARPGR